MRPLVYKQNIELVFVRPSLSWASETCFSKGYFPREEAGGEREHNLINHEVNKRDAKEATPKPDEEYFGLEVCVSGTVVDEIGC